MEPVALTPDLRRRRVSRCVAAWIAAVVVCALSGVARAQDPPSLEVARDAVEALRDDTHREAMRIVWPDLEDEFPPPGSEVLLVSGFRSSFQLTRITLRSESVAVASVSVGAGRTSAESAGDVEAWTSAVDATAFACVWNAARRAGAATEERVAATSEDADSPPLRIVCGPMPQRWARVSAGPAVVATYSAVERRRGAVRSDWAYMRQQAVLSILADFAATTVASRTSADASGWTAFAAGQVDAAAKRLGDPEVGDDETLLRACLRLLGEAGTTSAEVPVAKLRRALMGLDASARARLSSIASEAARAELQLRARHHFSRDEIRKMLREFPRGNRLDDLNYAWLRTAFRTRDPSGFAEFVAEELTDYGVQPAEVPALMAQIAALPKQHSLSVLRRLIAQPSPEVRLEAAIALHGADAASGSAEGIVVALALDRAVVFAKREDRAGTWVRTRALAAALDWGGLTPAQLREHVMSGQPDDPAFLREATRRLRGSPHALSSAELRDVWRRLLDAGTVHRVLAAVEFLVDDGDVDSRERMLAAIDRLGAVGGALDADSVPLAQWREFAAGVRVRADRHR